MMISLLKTSQLGITRFGITQLRISQIREMWRLITNGNYLLFGLAFIAVILMIVGTVVPDHYLAYLTVVVGFSIMGFANILLIMNAVLLADRKHLQLIPGFRRTLAVILILSFLLTASFVTLSAELFFFADEASFAYLFVLFLRIVLALLLFATTMLIFNFTFVCFAVAIFMFALAYQSHLSTPLWFSEVSLFLSSNHGLIELVLVIVVFSALLRWALSPLPRAKIFTTTLMRITKFVRNLEPAIHSNNYLKRGLIPSSNSIFPNLLYFLINGIMLGPLFLRRFSLCFVTLMILF